MAADATWLHSASVEDMRGAGSLRLEAGASLGRSITDRLVLGLTARALSYSKPSPVLGDLRLFWDPNALVAGGVYVQWDQDLTGQWTVRGRLNPSLALIDERTPGGFETVPHVSAEAGLSHKGGRFHTALDAFYYQGRFDGYQAYGLRLSVSARNWFRKEDGP
jgi:hypothetical protein